MTQQRVPQILRLTFPVQHTETEYIFDDLPDLSFPVFRPKYQQNGTATSGEASGDANGDGTEVEGDVEHDDLAGSGGN